MSLPNTTQNYEACAVEIKTAYTHVDFSEGIGRFVDVRVILKWI
jgi:hypothetical protein